MGQIGSAPGAKPGRHKIALIHDFLYTFAGAERVLLAMHELYPDAPIYTAFADPAVAQKHFPKAEIHTSYLQKRWRWLRKLPPFLMLAMPRAIESFNFSDYSMLLSSSGAYCKNLIRGPGCTHISYCHTPVRFAWDWHREYLSEHGVSGGLKLYILEHLLSYLRIWDLLGSDRVDHFIANSQAVAARIKKFYRRESQLIYPPVNTSFFDYHLVQTSKPKTPYAITVSRLTQSKRVDLIIEACAKVGLPLWIGGSGKDRPRLEQLAAKQSIPIRFLGAFSEEEKRVAIAGASCFIFATEDDFGIAPVEALALGVPVIAYGRGGATETVREGKSGWFFPDFKVESLAEKLGLFLKEGVAFSPEEIRQSALVFSEERFKEEIRRLVNSHA